MPDLMSRLPPVRGKLIPAQPLAPLTWFRVGGPADVLFQPADEADLAAFLAALPDDVPVTAIGVGSNLIVRDGGVAGVVVRLGGKAFSFVETDGLRVRAGAAALDAAAAKRAAEAGIAGLEFYRGVPGTIGGALRMNAGCYGAETKDVLVEAVALDRQGRRIVLSNADMGFTYRHTQAPEDLIFLEATFEGAADAPAAILARMEEITAKREASQPIREKTGGSTFANPDPEQSGGRKSWQLVDAVGGRGLQIGGARMSDLHCNFMLNTGDATAADLEALGEEIRARVQAQEGVTLRWEIKRIGRAAP
jgi:UDP-N-acetylmuramate dehydrogenase